MPRTNSLFYILVLIFVFFIIKTDVFDSLLGMNTTIRNDSVSPVDKSGGQQMTTQSVPKDDTFWLKALVAAAIAAIVAYFMLRIRCVS